MSKLFSFHNRNKYYTNKSLLFEVPMKRLILGPGTIKIF